MMELLGSMPPDKSRSPEGLREAYDYFARTLQLYPKGQYAEDVIRQMTRIRKKLAEYEINIIRSDLIEQNYTEVTRRANYVAEYYSDTPAHMKALELLIRGYTAQGDTRQADLTQKKLQQLQSAEHEKATSLVY